MTYLQPPLTVLPGKQTTSDVHLNSHVIAHVSIGGVLSGLAMASVFPSEAFAVLGFAVAGLPIVNGRLVQRGRRADI